jgi:hypothetical protein
MLVLSINPRSNAKFNEDSVLESDATFRFGAPPLNEILICIILGIESSESRRLHLTRENRLTARQVASRLTRRPSISAVRRYPATLPAISPARLRRNALPQDRLAPSSPDQAARASATVSRRHRPAAGCRCAARDCGERSGTGSHHQAATRGTASLSAACQPVAPDGGIPSGWPSDLIAAPKPKQECLMTVTPWIALSPLAAVILARNVSQDPFEDPRARCGTSRPLTGPVGADTLAVDRVDGSILLTTHLRQASSEV